MTRTHDTTTNTADTTTREARTRTTIEGRAATLVHTFAAPVERVWRAWTDPAQLSRWYCPNPDLETTFDGTVATGEDYVVHMGREHTLRGTYTQVVEHEHLEFTWAFDGDTASTVRVTFEPVGDETHVTLVHTAPESGDAPSGEAEGWAITLDRLDSVLAA